MTICFKFLFLIFIITALVNLEFSTASTTILEKNGVLYKTAGIINLTESGSQEINENKRATHTFYSHSHSTV